MPFSSLLNIRRDDACIGSAGSILNSIYAQIGFLNDDERQTLIKLTQDGLAQHRLTRRQNALILLDRGMSYRQVAAVLLIDDDTVRQWRQIFETEEVEGLAGFHFGGQHAFWSDEQQAELEAWVSATLPRSTREVGAFIEQRCGVSFASRSELIALLHLLRFVHRKPVAMASKMDPNKQRDFIAAYDNLLYHLPNGEMLMFVDSVHPVYSAQPVDCWARPDVALAVEQTTGREHLNIQGTIELEHSQTKMLPVERVNIESTIALLGAIRPALLWP